MLWALIFHMNIPRDKTFPWVPLFFTPWPWPWSLTHFLKTLTLLITFKQWVLELWYFTWIFSVIRSLCWYFTFWPWHLTYIFLNWHWSLLLNNKYWSFRIAHEHFLWQDLPTGIKIFVLVTLTIFGIGHYRRHLCFTNTSCYNLHCFVVKGIVGKEIVSFSISLQHNPQVFLSNLRNVLI